MPNTSSPLRIPCPQPFDWPGMLSFFRQRVVEGVEMADEVRYRRALLHGDEALVVEVTFDEGRHELLVATDRAPQGERQGFVDRIRRAFDLDTDMAAVTAALARDPFMAARLSERAAVRIPGTWNPFETSLRAVLGQQVSVVAARQLAGRLLQRAASTVTDGDGQTWRLFPTPRQVIEADLSAFGMPGSRVRTLQAIAQAAVDDPDLFHRGSTLDETISRLLGIKGIGPWTAHYIALRACREPDAFPASDVGLLRGMATNGVRPTPAELTARAEAWRPYRSYAAQYLWTRWDPAFVPTAEP